jgi:muconate cycloisomerase
VNVDRIERIDIHTVALPAVRAFAVSGGAVTTAGEPAIRVLVKVTTSDGATGWGESTPIPSWTYETTESIVSTLVGYLAPVAVGRPVWDLDGLNRAFDRTLNRGWSIGMPLARAAIDVACHDAYARSLGVPVARLWGRRRVDTIRLAWIIASQKPAEVADAVAEGHAHGYRDFKIKLGVHGVDDDVASVVALREAAPDAYLWVDANQAYTVADALRTARRLADLDIAVFEQPVASNDLVGLRRLRDASPITIAVDESLRHPTDLATFLKLDAIDVAVAKVQRCGGLTHALRQCQLAEDAGLAVMGSGLTESDIGLAASLHLFAAFGVDTPVDLNGRQFLTSPYATGPAIAVADGIAHVPTGPGLGIGVDETVVGELSRAHTVVDAAHR